MSAKDVKDKLAFLHSAIEAAQRDKNLSPAGVERQVKNLRESISVYYPDAYQEIEQAWQELRSRHKAILVNRREASEREAARWSYERLRYYKDRAGEELRRAQGLDEAEKIIKRAMDTGSKEQARAYLESGEVVRAHFSGDIRLGSTLGWMQRVAAELTTPAEFVELDAQEQELSREVLKLRDDTLEIANSYPHSIFESSKSISSLVDTASISAKVDGMSGDIAWCISWRDEP